MDLVNCEMNHRNVFLAIFLIVSHNTGHATGLNILAIISLPLRSHYMAFHRLFEEMAIRGHSVTVMNNYPQDSVKNMTFVDMTVHRPQQKTIPPMSEYEDFDTRFTHLINMYRHISYGTGVIEDDCENFFTNEKMKSFRKKGEKFDVIFVEQFMSDCGLAYTLAMYDAPIIGITSHTLLPWTYLRLGIPFNYASDAFYFSQDGVHPSLYTKVENFLLHNVMVYFGRWYVQRSLYKVFDKYLPNNKLNVEKNSKERMKMVFVYQHHSVTGARLLSPQLLEIGGVHIQRTRPIPKIIEDFLSDAKHGAIYVSFGSNLNANTMSESKMQQFLDAFKKMPQKVLWKVDNVTLSPEYHNVYVHKWFPQLDVLCHPKVLGFISHGGMLSLSEAAHCGKPLITIPFFGDQFSNAAAASDSGIGIKMHFQNLEANSLVAAVKKLTSPGMQQTAKKVSKLWHDRLMDVLDSAIYWTEYVARHREAPPSLPSKRNTWFELCLIDVYAVLIGILLAISLVMYIILKVVISIVKLFLFKNKHKKE